MKAKKWNRILFINRLENKKHIKFDGIVPNKLGNIIYIRNEKGILKTKSNRPVLPIYQDEEFTYYFRLQGINKKHANWALPELLKSVKTNQYGNLPKKDSWLCFDIVYKMKTKDFNHIFGLDIDSSIQMIMKKSKKYRIFKIKHHLVTDLIKSIWCKNQSKNDSNPGSCNMISGEVSYIANSRETSKNGSWVTKKVKSDY